ncbi:hypothetical protein BDA99DRAFT_497402 [Phascolomyces articulosus]|uniref:S-adenosyl-L-methionine-dependent methyltransferase n=1 Tax=Phascolomyces articulosus TaxID=60185 RepID=A0AAD5KKQ4_9FUNG|nr:hypothetical protein BDA99DRAFT_497402 [Phascolomyces articulosus]
MGNRISRRSKASVGGKSGDSGESVDFAADGGVTSTHSVPKFPEFPAFPIVKSEEELTRQRNEHFLLKHVFQKSYFAPVDAMLQRKDSNVVILDYNGGYCCTWIVEMANDFPNAMCYGLNMFRVPEPEDFHHMPSNIHLDQSNILQGGLGHSTGSIDFIHQRGMLHAYHGDDISFVMREMKRLLKPGGYLELVEYDIVPKRAGPLYTKLMDCIHNYLKTRQKHLFNGPRLRRFLEESGFQDIHYEYASIPACWGGYMGKLMYENILMGIRHLGPVIYQELFHTDAEFDEAHFEEFIDKAFDECVQYQTFSNVHWAYGRKPLLTTSSSITTTITNTTIA